MFVCTGTGCQEHRAGRSKAPPAPCPLAGDLRASPASSCGPLPGLSRLRGLRPWVSFVSAPRRPRTPLTVPVSCGLRPSPPTASRPSPLSLLLFLSSLCVSRPSLPLHAPLSLRVSAVLISVHFPILCLGVSPPVFSPPLPSCVRLLHLPTHLEETFSPLASLLPHAAGLDPANPSVDSLRCSGSPPCPARSEECLHLSQDASTPGLCLVKGEVSQTGPESPGVRVDPKYGREDRAFGGRTVGRPRVKSDKFRDTRKYQLPGKGARTDC